jgi:hypothetical protein
MWPETRIALTSYAEGFACSFGAKVRDIVDVFGPALGVELKEDTRSKGEWVISRHGGGMVCKGRGGALNGRPADLLILDDLIKNAEEAQSPTILDGIWDWYGTVAYSRLGPTAPIVNIGTRWVPQDLFGRLKAESKVGGDRFNTVLFKAIATENDILGRKPGEALWPERVPLSRLQKIQRTRPRWFKACWQGQPEEDSGLHFQPREWGTYTDVGDAWRVKYGTQWHSYRKVDCTIIVALDWAQKAKKDSDHTAFVVAALTCDGLLLVLHVFNRRLRYEENAPTLAKLCREWKPDIAVAENDMLSDAMVVECRRCRDIPEVRRLAIKSKKKLVRAQAGIIRSQNGLIRRPDPQLDWFEMMADQLSSFSGEDGAEDDIADCFGILGRLADEFNPGTDSDGYEPVLGSTGYDGGLWGFAD